MNEVADGFPRQAAPGESLEYLTRALEKALADVKAGKVHQMILAVDLDGADGAGVSIVLCGHGGGRKEWFSMLVMQDIIKASTEDPRPPELGLSKPS